MPGLTPEGQVTCIIVMAERVEQRLAPFRCSLCELLWRLKTNSNNKTQTTKLKVENNARLGEQNSKWTFRS
jgi:hypothetical protein